MHGNLGRFSRFTILILAAVAAGAVLRASAPTGRTLIVGGGEPGSYATINAALADAEDGDTLFVCRGVYFENLSIDKSVSLLGEDRNATIVDGSHSGNVIRLLADGVLIRNFTIRNSGRSQVPLNDAAIKIRSRFNRILDNRIVDNLYAMVLLDSANKICRNFVAHNQLDGILFQDGQTIQHNTVAWNTFTDNGRIGVHMGAYGLTGPDQQGGGITANRVFGNVFSNHGYRGVCKTTAGGNEFFHNVFKNNLDHNACSYFPGDTWTAGYPGGGNYWDDYEGVDKFHGPNQDIPGADGIGDTPYRGICGGNDEDPYPLMQPVPLVRSGDLSGDSGQRTSDAYLR